MFCSSHRHAEGHKCAFDFMDFDRKKLEKANPKIGGDHGLNHRI
jgi:hypothetical protein